jgi:hypothetical protein
VRDFTPFAEANTAEDNHEIGRPGGEQGRPDQQFRRWSWPIWFPNGADGVMLVSNCPGSW